MKAEIKALIEDKRKVILCPKHSKPKKRDPKSGKTYCSACINDWRKARNAAKSASAAQQAAEDAKAEAIWAKLRDPDYYTQPTYRGRMSPLASASQMVHEMPSQADVRKINQYLSGKAPRNFGEAI